MGRTQQGLVNAFITIIFLYFVSCSFAALYFNWEYARENGFAKWILFGEFARDELWAERRGVIRHRASSRACRARNVPIVRRVAICDGNRPHT